MGGQMRHTKKIFLKTVILKQNVTEGVSKKRLKIVTYYLNGHYVIFSSEYDVCVEKYFSEKLCSQFPPSQPCKCPIKAGEVQIEGLEYQIPDPGFYGYFMTVSI